MLGGHTFTNDGPLLSPPPEFPRPQLDGKGPWLSSAFRPRPCWPEDHVGLENNSLGSRCALGPGMSLELAAMQRLWGGHYGPNVAEESHGGRGRGVPQGTTGCAQTANRDGLGSFEKARFNQMG